MNFQNACPFYRFPSDEGFEYYRHTGLKISDIRKKVINLRKGSDDGNYFKLSSDYVNKTKSEREMLITTA